MGMVPLRISRAMDSCTPRLPGTEVCVGCGRGISSRFINEFTALEMKDHICCQSEVHVLAGSRRSQLQ